MQCLITKQYTVWITIKMPDKNIFPIHTKTACPLKWNWSTIYFHSGTTSSCHRTEKLAIPRDGFADFHNLPKKIQDRERMLEGVWPENTCGYCSKVERQGGYSDRMNQLSQLTDPDNVPPELKTNNSATSVTPTFIEVYFRNTCNMSCVYCGPHFSSKWEDEILRHGPIAEMQGNRSLFSVQAIQDNSDYEKHKKEFWRYLLENDRYRTLRWFSFLGGEPLVIPELDECLDFWNNNPNDKLTFQMVTNLKANDTRFDSFLDKVKTMCQQKKVYKFKIIASIDCLGPEIEYVRHGIDLKKWIVNFEKILELKDVDVGINSAISALTLKSYPALLDKINDWNSHRPKKDRILLSFNLDTTMTDPKMLGGVFFKHTLEQCNEKMLVHTFRDISIKKHWLALGDSILRADKSPAKIQTLKTYLTKLDERRGTQWKKTFPWLVDL